MLALAGCASLLFACTDRGDATGDARPAPSARRGVGCLGFWEVVARSASGFGSALEIRADGSARWGGVILVEQNDELRGETLFLRSAGKVTLRQPVGTVRGEPWTSLGGRGPVELRVPRLWTVLDSSEDAEGKLALHGTPELDDVSSEWMRDDHFFVDLVNHEVIEFRRAEPCDPE